MKLIEALIALLLVSMVAAGVMDTLTTGTKLLNRQISAISEAFSR